MSAGRNIVRAARDLGHPSAPRTPHDRDEADQSRLLAREVIAELRTLARGAEPDLLSDTLRLLPSVDRPMILVGFLREVQAQLVSGAQT